MSVAAPKGLLKVSVQLQRLVWLQLQVKLVLKMKLEVEMQMSLAFLLPVCYR